MLPGYWWGLRGERWFSVSANLGMSFSLRGSCSAEGFGAKRIRAGCRMPESGVRLA